MNGSVGLTAARCRSPGCRHGAYLTLTVILSEASGAGGVGMRAYVFDRSQGRKALFLPQAVGARFWPVKSTASPL